MNEQRFDIKQACHACLNSNVIGLRTSSTIAINERSNEFMRAGKPVFKLGLGQSPFPVPDPVVDALKSRAHEKDYLPVRGLFELRQAVAEHHNRNFGIDCCPDDVLIGPGSKELMFLLQLVYDGELLIPSPSWVSYEPQARIIGRRVHSLPTSIDTDWMLTTDSLDEYCSSEMSKPRILVLNYPSNPTGMTFSDDQLRDLAEVARKHQLVILSDEIYGKLHHQGEHHSIVSHYPDGTIFSGGLSKWCGAGGWRLGLFVFPKKMRWLLDAMAAVGSETYTSTSAPIQFAAVRAFQECRWIDNYLVHSRRILRALGSFATLQLHNIGANVAMPQAGFYLFPDFSALRKVLHRRGIGNSEQFCERLMNETGVAILPGCDFGRPPEEFTARLALVDFDGKEALNASEESLPSAKELDHSFLRVYCNRVITAIEIICRWLQTGI